MRATYCPKDVWVQAFLKQEGCSFSENQYNKRKNIISANVLIMSVHGIMKETQTMHSAPYSQGQMNTIKLQREELTHTGIFSFFLFIFSSGKLLLIFLLLLTHCLYFLLRKYLNISIPLEPVPLVVSTGSYDSVAGCLLSASSNEKEPWVLQKTSSTSWTSLLLFFLSEKGGKK